MALKTSDGFLRLRTADDGVGIAAEGTRNGLANIAGRAAVFGGSFTIGPGAQGGSVLLWQVPRRHVLETTGRKAPQVMTDGRTPSPRSWSSGYDPVDPVDRAILATCRNIFPWHGLDPWS